MFDEYDLINDLDYLFESDKSDKEDKLKINVVPKKSVGPIKIGESRSNVQSIGSKYSTFTKSKTSKNSTDDFGWCHVYYSKDNKCEAVEVFVNDIELSINGKPFPTNINDVKSIVSDLKEDESNSYISISKSIGISVNSNGKITSVLFGNDNYYKSTDVKESTNEYDLSIFRSNIAFEKAYNEFELFNGLAYLTEAEDDNKSSKSEGVFKNLISAIMKVINSLIDKIGSLIEKAKSKFTDKNEKINVAYDPKDSAKKCEEIRKSGFSIIDKIKKAKSKEEIDKEMDQWSSKSKKTKKVAKAVAITAGALFTAFTAVQTSLRLTYKEAAKQTPPTGNKTIDDLVNAKHSAIASIFKTLKGVLVDEVTEVGRFINKPQSTVKSFDREYNAARAKNQFNAEKKGKKHEEIVKDISKKRQNALGGERERLGNSLQLHRDMMMNANKDAEKAAKKIWL